MTVLALSGDALGALAEDELLAEPEVRQRSFSAEVASTIARAMAEERHEADLYEQGVSANVDPATLAKRYGSPPPIKVDPAAFFGSYHPPPTSARATGLGVTNDGRFERTGRPVQAVRPAAGGKAQIVFRDKVSMHEVQECYPTDRIVGATFDTRPATVGVDSGTRTVATLLYETQCKTVGTETEVEKTQPIVVAKEEAIHLQSNELVSAFVDKKTRLERQTVRFAADYAAAASA